MVNPCLLHYCRVCNIQLNSCRQAKIHSEGKKHEKRLSYLKFCLESSKTTIHTQKIQWGHAPSLDRTPQKSFLTIILQAIVYMLRLGIKIFFRWFMTIHRLSKIFSMRFWAPSRNRLWRFYVYINSNVYLYFTVISVGIWPMFTDTRILIRTLGVGFACLYLKPILSEIHLGVKMTANWNQSKFKWNHTYYVSLLA